MLSILIPTYNFDCLNLIAELAAQCKELRSQKELSDYEIIIADDASTNKDLIQFLLGETKQLYGVRWILNTQNAGRSKIRNMLLDESCGEWGIMIDADACVVSKDFVRQYWNLRHQAEVICGDLVNPEQCEKGHELRFYYEKSAESQRLAKERMKHPYSRFSTFNFFARLSTIKSIGFCESIKEYGYEDTLLGFELKKRNVAIMHIDNPLLHLGIDPSEVYLNKTQASLRTLSKLPTLIQKDFKIAQLTRQFKKWHLAPVLIALFKTIQPVVEKQLLSRRPLITLFQFYKLGYYLTISN